MIGIHFSCLAPNKTELKQKPQKYVSFHAAATAKCLFTICILAFVMQNNTSFLHMIWGLKFISSRKNMMSLHFGMKNINYLFLIPPLSASISRPFLFRAISCNPVFFLVGRYSHLRKKSHIAALVDSSRKILNWWDAEKIYLSFMSFRLWVVLNIKA